MKRLLNLFGRSLRSGLLAIGALSFSGGILALANYTFTQGAGTTFGSVIVSGVHYAQMFLCDLTTPSQCAAVSAGGAVKVDASATTQPVSSTTLATATNQTNASQKTKIVDGSGNVIASTSNALNVDVINTNVNGQETMDNSSPVVIASNQSNIPVINGASRYQHVAASQTAAVLQSSAGAAGDYLSHCVIYPSTTGAGSVTVFDNTNSAANNVIEFTTGTLSNLAPIAIPVGAISLNGPWKVTTGANETVVCYGKFS